MAKMNSNIETIGLKIKKKLLNLQRKVEDKEREIFHTKFPKDPKLLYQELLKHKKEIDKLRNKNVINDKQYELIFPINKETDSDQWDPTLLHTLLRTLFGYKRPKNGWNNEPDANDQSQLANLIRLKVGRNKIVHLSIASATEYQYKSIYKYLIKNASHIAVH